MIKNYLLGLLKLGQAKLIDIKHHLDNITFWATVVTITMTVVVIVGMLLKSNTITFIGTFSLALIFVILHWVAVIVTEGVQGALKEIAARGKDEKAVKRHLESLEKISLGFKRTCDLFCTTAVTISTFGVLILAGLFQGAGFGAIQFAAMVLMGFMAIGLYAKREWKLPRNAAAALMILSSIVWFSNLNYPISRAIKSRLDSVTVNTEKNTQARANSVIITTCPVYSYSKKTGDLDEVDSLKLEVGQIVRKVGDRKMIGGELFIEITVPNDLGSYGKKRGTRYWVQPEVLSSGDDGLKVFPNTIKPEYAVKKTSSRGGAENWEIYFLNSDTVTLVDLPLGKRVTVISEGVYGYDSEFNRYVAMTPGRRSEGRMIISATTIIFKKGGKAIISFS